MCSGLRLILSGRKARGLVKGEKYGMWRPLIVGLIALGFSALRIFPSHLVMADGHPDFSYYAYSFRHWSYSDVVALYGSRRLFLHQLPYVQNVIEYPVLIGLYMSVMAHLPGFPGYFLGSLVGLSLGFFGALWALRAGRGSAAWWFAATPMLTLYGLTNWDLLGIATWGMAVLAYERERWWTSGLWVGIGVATKFFPIVLLPYLAFGLWRRRDSGHRRHLRQFLGAAALAGIIINLPFAITGWRGWTEFFTFNSGRAPDPGLWARLVAIHWLRIADVNLLTLAITAAGGVLLLDAMRKERLNPVEAAGSALAWWLLVNKVYSPQYMLWAYYAALWCRATPVKLVFMNIAGVCDFFLAMRWLELGTTGSPFLAPFVARIPGPVIALRDTALFWAAITWKRPVFLHNRTQARQV